MSDSPFSFASIQNAGDAPVMPDPPEMQNLRQGLAQTPQLQANLQGLQDFQVNQKLTSDMNSNPAKDLESISFNQKDGSFTAKGSQQALESLMRDRQQLNEIRGAFHQQAQILQAREDAARNAPPWVQLATTLAGNLASAPNMPGWVQAAGRTSQQLNPRPEELAARKLQVLGEEAGIAEKQAGLDVGLLRTLQEGQLHQATTANLQEQRRQTNVEHALDNLSQSISKGPGQMDPESAAKVLASAGATSHEIGVKLEQLQTLAGNVGKAFEITRADKETAQKLAADASERSDKRTAALIGQMATVAAQKSEGEKAIEATAQSLANGDLTALRDVSSMRNDARARIYARVKELNPNFSTSEVDRKITTLKSFTDGKDGQAIQSFDTFLQHAGEVTETLKGVEQSNTPAFNKPMNWWKKNMAGSPEYQRLITSIEPVGKEFEKFLLNGAALYQDDRKKIDTLLSGDSSPAQILAALNQMGKTAQDRYGAMNQRYKRVMGSDIENPFSEDAISGAQKIGVKITPGTTTTKPSGKYFDAASGKWVTQ